MPSGTPSTSYGYDLNGNRTHEDGLQVAVFDTQDRLATYNGTTYTYTDSGSLTSKSDGVDTTTYQYDLLGNLRDATLSDGTTIHYEVDGKNRRIGKTVDGVQEYRFVYRDQLNPIAMFDGNGDLTARFVYGTKGHVPDYMVKDGDTYRFITDHLGSVRLLVNANDGTIAQKISYDEWGNVTNDTNPGFQPFGFAGGLYDTDTGLVRFGARDYDPSVGRWTAKDPILFEGGQVNLYVYVGNDPVNGIDPSGMVDWDLLGDVFWDYFASGRALDNMIGAAKAELSIAAGVAEGYLAVGTGGAAGAFVGTHAVGNFLGGVGDYLNVVDGGNRDWNITRQGYENITEFACDDPSIGKKAFHLTDAAIGVGAMATPQSAYQSLPMGIERYYSQPAVFQAGITTILHDSVQVLMSIDQGVNP